MDAMAAHMSSAANPANIGGDEYLEDPGVSGPRARASTAAAGEDASLPWIANQLTYEVCVGTTPFEVMQEVWSC